MKRHLILVVVIATLALAACTSAAATATSRSTAVAAQVTPTLAVLSVAVTVGLGPTVQPVAGKPFTPKVALINGHQFNLELAQTEEERERGLMRRTSLTDDYGMLFIYDRDEAWPFWMMDTKIALDIIWIRADGAIVDVQTMAPEAKTASGEYRIYKPSGPARLVMEMDAGVANRFDIKPGSHVDFFG